MTFKKSGFTVQAIQMVMPFSLSGHVHRAGSWIVLGWLEGERVGMSDADFQATFGHRSAA